MDVSQYEFHMNIDGHIDIESFYPFRKKLIASAADWPFY
jgi:hypothetical protein